MTPQHKQNVIIQALSDAQAVQHVTQDVLKFLLKAGVNVASQEAKLDSGTPFMVVLAVGPEAISDVTKRLYDDDEDASGSPVVNPDTDPESDTDPLPDLMVERSLRKENPGVDWPNRGLVKVDSSTSWGVKASSHHTPSIEEDDKHL